MARLDCKVVGTISGGPPLVLQIPMKASSTFQLGEFVRLDSANTLSVAITAAEAFGIAADDATTTPGGSTSKAAGTLISVWPFDSNTIFSVKIVSGTFVQAEAGQGFDFAIVSTVHGVAADTTVISLLRAIRVDPTDSTRLLMTGAHNDALASNKGSQFLGNATRAA
jgi:hypothetical protein